MTKGELQIGEECVFQHRLANIEVFIPLFVFVEALRNIYFAARMELSI